MRLPLYFGLFLLGLAIAQTLYFYPLLPEIVGSHFDAAGKVNGTSAKLTYFILYYVSLAIASFFTLGLPCHKGRLKVQALGVVGNNKDVGFFIHPTLVLSAETGFP